MINKLIVFLITRYRRLEDTMNAEGLSDQEVILLNFLFEMIIFVFRNLKNVIYMQPKKLNIYV